MDCRYCGNGTTDGGLFPGEGLTPGEIARRTELFRQAREGRAEALTALKSHYGVTGIWDGKKLINL